MKEDTDTLSLHRLVAVAEKIAASGSEQAEEAKETQKESLELRKLINGLVLQERTRNI